MIKSISLKTQARRLTYLTHFLDNLKENGVNYDSFIQNITNWISNHSNDFNKLSNSSGEINLKSKNKRNAGIENYLTLAKHIELIEEIKGKLYPIKFGKTLKALISELNNQSINPFLLTKVEKIYYLFLLLKYDVDSIITILHMIKDYNSFNLSILQKNYQKYYLERINQVLENTVGYKRVKIIEVKKRVQNWQKAEKYSEDIVPPRVNWLTDINILNYENDSYTKNISFDILYLSLKKQKFVVNDLWLTNNYSSLAIDIFNCEVTRNWKDLNLAVKNDLLEESLFKSFKYFKSLNLPRLPYEQTLLFIILYMMLKNLVAVDMKELIHFIGHEKIIGNKKVGLRKAARIYESYIIYADVK